MLVQHDYERTTSDAINLGNIVKNDYQLTLTGDTTTGILSKAITGSGNVIINGDITSNVSILNNITINENYSLSLNNVGIETGIITNSGTLNLNDGSTDSVNNTGTININGGSAGAIDNAGTVNINADYEISNGITADTYANTNIVNIGNGINTNETTLKSAITKQLINISNNTTLTLDDETGSITNSNINVSSAGKLIADAGNITNAPIASAGVLELKGINANQISGYGDVYGSLKLTDTLTNNSTITVNTIDLNDKNLAGSGLLELKGINDISTSSGTISQRTGGIKNTGTLTANASQITATVTNDGTYNILGSKTDAGRLAQNNIITQTSVDNGTVNFGDGTVSNGDIYIINEQSHEVYYLKGVVYEGETYYAPFN